MVPGRCHPPCGEKLRIVECHVRLCRLQRTPRAPRTWMADTGLLQRSKGQWDSASAQRQRPAASPAPVVRVSTPSDENCYSQGLVLWGFRSLGVPLRSSVTPMRRLGCVAAQGSRGTSWHIGLNPRQDRTCGQNLRRAPRVRMCWSRGCRACAQHAGTACACRHVGTGTTQCRGLWVSPPFGVVTSECHRP